ncbi:MAG: branched-chain amino acid ABC transporter permease, partial [Desulfobacterales bacterium]
MTDFLQMILSGVAVGSFYALMGLGMVLIYKASEVPNFVQGEMALLPVFLAYMLLETYGLPWFVAFPV